MLLAVWIILAIVCVTVLACALLTHYILTKDNKIEGTAEAWEEGKLGRDIAYAKISALDSEYMKELIKSNDNPVSTHTSLVEKE